MKLSLRYYENFKYETSLALSSCCLAFLNVDMRVTPTRNQTRPRLTKEGSEGAWPKRLFKEGLQSNDFMEGSRTRLTATKHANVSTANRWLTAEMRRQNRSTFGRGHQWSVCAEIIAAWGSIQVYALYRRPTGAWTITSHLCVCFKCRPIHIVSEWNVEPYRTSSMTAR